VSCSQSRSSIGNPGLTFGRVSSPTTSPAQVTPHDDIVGFTPRGHGGLKTVGDIVEDSKASIELTSSPTVQIANAARYQIAIPGTSSGRIVDKDDGEDVFDAVTQDKEKARLLTERSRLLAARKAEAMLAIKNSQKGIAPSISDDEFEIFDESKPPSKAAESFASNVIASKPGPTRRGPDAKAILNRNLGNDVPIMTKNRQKILRYAGVSARAREDVTETHVDFAAKAWKHGEMKHLNGGAAPAGQKKGRDIIITQAQLDNAVKMSHIAQMKKLQAKKEADWGRARNLPERREQNIEALVAATAQQSMTREDSDEEDDDFVPDDENDIGESDVEKGDEVRYYSGEETEGDDVEETEQPTAETADSVEPTSTDEGPKPDSIEDDEKVQVVKRKARPSNRVAYDSDDDAATPRASQKHVQGRNILSQPKMAGSAIGKSQSIGEDIDLGGFGDDGEGGFSQLFEATQVDDQPAQIVSFTRSYPEIRS